jgi:hypothetical protein
MPYKWTPGPGHATFELNGKVYQPGDMIPISRASAEHHMQFGHVFEGVDAPELPGPSGGAAVPAAAPVPAKAE